MPKPPPRFKSPDQFTPDEQLAAIQADRRGQSPPKFETAEYRAAMRGALQGAGLHVPDEYADDDAPKPPDEMSPDDHLRQMRGGR